MDYTLDSYMGCRLDLLYKEILEELLNTMVHVSGEEISDGKYNLKLLINGYSYFMVSKAWYTVDAIVECLIDCVIQPFSQNKNSLRQPLIKYINTNDTVYKICTINVFQVGERSIEVTFCP